MEALEIGKRPQLVASESFELVSVTLRSLKLLKSPWPGVVVHVPDQVHAHHGGELANAATRLDNQHITVAMEGAEIVNFASPRCTIEWLPRVQSRQSFALGESLASPETEHPPHWWVCSLPVQTETNHLTACLVPRLGTLQGAKTLRRN